MRMSEEDKKKKFDKQRKTLLKTKEKRKSQRPLVFELKIDTSHLNKEEQIKLKMPGTGCFG